VACLVSLQQRRFAALRSPLTLSFDSQNTWPAIKIVPEMEMCRHFWKQLDRIDGIYTQHETPSAGLQDG
jgi:hypothetical protein